MSNRLTKHQLRLLFALKSGATLRGTRRLDYDYYFENKYHVVSASTVLRLIEINFLSTDLKLINNEPNI